MSFDTRQMTSQPDHEPTARSRTLLYALTLLVVAAGAWFWSRDLAADPPRYYSALGQAVLTDPANVVYHARNDILFDNPDPFDYGRYVVFQRSLMSITTLAWGTVVGISYAKANAAALILNLSALLLLLIGLARNHRPWTLLVVAVVWLVNATMIVYGRLPFLENGLLVLATFAFFVYARWGDRVWGIALTAAAIAAATVMGKLFGALLIPALLVAILIVRHEQRRLHLLVATGAYIGVLAGLVLLLYGGRIGTVFGYVGEQAYGLRGFPEGLTSPWAFVEHVMTYGAANRIFYLTPDLLMMIVLGGLGLVLLAPWRIRPLPRATVFAVAWSICVVGGLSPLNYSPLRYALLLFPAVFAGCFGLLDLLFRESHLEIPRLNPMRSLFAGLIVWYALIHTTGMTFANLQLSPRLLTWVTLPIAALLVWGLAVRVRRKAPIVKRRWVITAAVALVAVSMVSNGVRVFQTQVERRSHNLVDDSRELAMILGPDAVLSGPYGPALAMETHLKSFIHMFGESKPDPTLFERKPVTHLLVDEANYVEAVKAYPALQRVPAIASYWIAGWQVKLYDISGVFGNPVARQYQPTEFELAIKAYQKGQVDEAWTRLQSYLNNHPLTKSPGTFLTELLMRRSERPEALETITRLAEQYPNDFLIRLQLGGRYYLAGSAGNDSALLAKAEAAFADCLEIDPTQAATIAQVRDQVDRMIGAGR